MARIFVVVGVLLALLVNVIAVPFTFDLAKATNKWETVEFEETETNLRSSAATSMNGFITGTTYMGASCSSYLVDTVLPLNRCIPDVFGMTNSPYLKITLLSNQKGQLQGFKDYSCHNSAPKAKFTQFPAGICTPTDDGHSMMFGYAPTRPTHTEMWTTKYD